MRATKHSRRWSLPALLLGAVLALACALAAQTPPPVRNPYDSQLAALVSALPKASAPEAAVLLRRIYDLRDYVDQPADATRAITRVAQDENRHPLVRDEALRLLASIDIHENQLDQAREKLRQLGFVREWAIAGPFTTSPGLDTQFGPEQGFSDREFADGGRQRRWRPVPDLGSLPWVELSDFYPQAVPAVAFAATSLFSDSQRTVALRFGADSEVALFVDGHQVLRDDGESGMAFDQYAVAVELHPGWNSILLKLYRTSQGPWRFALRVSRIGGSGLQMTASSAEASQPSVGSTNVLLQPEDLVVMAQQTADAEQSAANLETLGRIERDHSHGSSHLDTRESGAVRGTRSWLEHFEDAVGRQPTATRWLLVARSCLEPACQLTALNAALEADPANTAAQLAMADYYLSRRQFEKARDLLRGALARAPENFVVRKRLSDVYASAGLDSLALQECRRIENEFPAPLWVRRELAARYVDLGLLDQAKVLLESALARNWDGSEERGLLLRIYERRRDAEHLRASYSEMARLHPTDTLPLVRMAQIDAGENRLDSARSIMQAALEIAPESDTLHQQFAEILGSAGRAEAAHSELARALELNPQLVQVRRRLEATGGASGSDDPDNAYLANAPQLAAEARSAPPAAEANAIALADVRVERVYENGLSSVRTQQVFYVANLQSARALSSSRS